MILLTDKEGYSCLVNPEVMTLVVREKDKATKKEFTIIYIIDGITIQVQDTPEEIYQIIEEYYDENYVAEFVDEGDDDEVIPEED
jgi:hypothetical protein